MIFKEKNKKYISIKDQLPERGRMCEFDVKNHPEILWGYIGSHSSKEIPFLACFIPHDHWAITDNWHNFFWDDKLDEFVEDYEVRDASMDFVCNAKRIAQGWNYLN